MSRRAARTPELSAIAGPNALGGTLMTGVKPQLLTSNADQGSVRPSPRLLAVPLWMLAAGGVTGALLTSRADDWTPIGLVGLLLVISVSSDALGVQTRGMRLSGSFIAIVLAMALLGPAPAVAIAIATI